MKFRNAMKKIVLLSQNVSFFRNDPFSPSRPHLYIDTYLEKKIQMSQTPHCIIVAGQVYTLPPPTTPKSRGYQQLGEATQANWMANCQLQLIQLSQRPMSLGYPSSRLKVMWMTLTSEWGYSHLGVTSTSLMFIQCIPFSCLLIYINILIL